ncbi:MAG: MBL fold metallo-hydrolase [Acidobacteria bacterium]|nr:MBL fold metallo-hydrolase [Acidobacteriota bacterium]
MRDFQGHYQTFVEGLESMGRSVKDVEAIVITHAHGDHVGFAERVRVESGAKVFVHEADREAVGRARQLPWWALISNTWRPHLGMQLMIGALNGVFWGPGVEKAVGCRDGQVLDVPGRPRMLHLAGHTAGASALYLEKERVLLSGDALVTLDLFSGARIEPDVTRPQVNADHAEALRSRNKLAELGPVTLLRGHGAVWKGDLEKIKRA